ncbi:hypothetical protein SAMN04489760_1223 [Syntrophus gentianae]|uniref:Uncharacterized protein n=1 Tax=Syntrophus gentianae TaxID=43775 RepID=A0A1H7ZDQ5_9BACT|nr:hypothetical protein [Syntrophus gentianae]SEM55658.1 hypothetical protein SAMN04489760_1223 [Syntrophus gentianae]
MAIICTLSNHWRYQLGAKAVDIANDTFKAILMDDTFVFDKDTHATLADVTASPSTELPTGNGYTRQNKTLSGGSWAENDTSDKGVRTFDNISWTASGGAIGPIGSLVIYDDTTSDDTVVGCIDFGTDYTIPEGSTFQVQAPAIEI